MAVLRLLKSKKPPKKKVFVYYMNFHLVRISYLLFIIANEPVDLNFDPVVNFGVADFFC
jgi:hypothetical protein